MDLSLRQSTPKIEGFLQVSKWLKCAILLDRDEMQELLETLAEVYFFNVSAPVEASEACLSSAQFLKSYGQYVDILKRGEIPSPDAFRSVFSSALSKTSDPFYSMRLSDGRFLVKPIQPVIQLQAHYFFYSTLDKKFHSMVQSSDSVSWGVQFSYPQLFQDPHTRKVVKVLSQEEFVNTALFSTLMQWMRSHTLPTPFLVHGVRTNSPMRVGKKALSWVSDHPQLKQKGIEIILIGESDVNRDRIDWR